MVLVFTLCLLLLSLTRNCCRCNETIDSYMSTEKTFINDLENYIESQESILQLLRKKLLNFKVEHSEAVENPESYFTNELNKFLLVKRLSSDINLISDKTYDVAFRFKSKVSSYKNDKALPSKDDLKASALSIAKLQKDQRLRTDKLAKGIFGDIKRRLVDLWRWLSDFNKLIRAFLGMDSRPKIVISWASNSIPLMFTYLRRNGWRKRWNATTIITINIKWKLSTS